MYINIAVVSMGYWGKNLVRNFYEIGVLKVICDSDASRRTTIEEKYPGVEFNQDFLSVLEYDSIQAVVIATPAFMHYEMVKQVLEAGKDVFVEKPLAMELAQGEELVSLAARRQKILMVGHILHYHPAVIKLKELINEGTLGRIQYIHSNRLNIGKIRTEENTRTMEALNEQRKSLKGSKVLIVGLAYKGNVDDIRESPSLVLINMFEEKGAKVAYYNPYIPEIPPVREHAHLSGRKSIALEEVSNYDVAVISTQHLSVDHTIFADKCKLVIDTRNALAQLSYYRTQVFVKP